MCINFFKVFLTIKFSILCDEIIFLLTFVTLPIYTKAYSKCNQINTVVELNGCLARDNSLVESNPKLE